MKLKTCFICKNVYLAQNTKPVVLDDKPAIACNDCIDKARGIVKKEDIFENLNSGNYKIKS
jgi:hypothetical protein